MYLGEFKGIAAFENPTLKHNFGETFAHFINIIQNTDYIIICDADLDDYSLNIFETYFDKKVSKINFSGCYLELHISYLLCFNERKKVIFTITEL